MFEGITGVVVVLVVLWLIGARVKKSLNKSFDYLDMNLDVATAELKAENKKRMEAIKNGKQDEEEL